MAKHTPKQYFDKEGSLIIKPYRLKDLAAIFDVNVQTLKRWMNKFDELKEKDGKYYTVTQVTFCIEQFGLPHKVRPVVKMDVMQKVA